MIVRSARRLEWAAILLLLLAAWALRLYALDAQDIWWDEARNIAVATRPLTQIAGSMELDIHPPAYFYGLHLWTRAAGASAFAVRFFSVWFGVLAVALSYRLARGLAPGQPGRAAGILALGLATVSPYAVAEAQETRMYTLSWVLLSAAMLALWQATRRPIPGSRSSAHPSASPPIPSLPWLLFAFFAAASLLTHYSTVFILAAWGVWLLVWALRGPDRSVRLWTLGLVGLVLVLLCLPALPIALRQIPGYKNPNLSLPGLPDYMSQLFHAFVLGEHAPEPGRSLGRWLWLAVGVAGAILALRRPYRSAHVALLALWLFGGLALYYAVLLRRPAFNPRYISFVLPAIWALTGWALTGWRRLARPLPYVMAAGLMLVAIPSLRADLTDPRFFHDDTRGVVSWLMERATNQDIVLVDQAYPFGFYWQRWNNDWAGSPPAEPADQPPAQYLSVDINAIDERLSELAGNARTVYWVTWSQSDMDPFGAVSALLDAHGTQVGEQAFRGYLVRWWQLDPPTRFHLFDQLTPVDVGFEPGVWLVDGDWSGREKPAPAGGRGLVTLRWQADSPTARPLKVSLRLKDASDKTVSQEDRVLFNGLHLRTTSWTPGDTALSVYSLSLPEQQGTYTLSAVLYDEETLEPVGLLNGLAPGSPSGGIEARLGTVQVGPGQPAVH